MAWSSNQPKKQDNRKNSWGRGWKWQGHWDWGSLEKIWKKGGGRVGNKGGLVPLCQLPETFEISHPPHYKTNPPFLASPHFWQNKIKLSTKFSHPSITAIFQKSHPPIMQWGGYDYVPSIHYMIKGFKTKTEELCWCHFHCLMHDAKDKFLLLGLFCTSW